MEDYAKKYGFSFVAASIGDSVVRAYLLKHLIDTGLPLDTQPSAEKWCAVMREEDKRIYCVFGWRVINDSTIEVTDFFLYPHRWGIFAGYAALQKIKGECDLHHTAAVTMTPYHNDAMMEAYKKVFGLDEPVLVVYRYDPPKGAHLVMPDVTASEEVTA